MHQHFTYVYFSASPVYNLCWFFHIVDFSLSPIKHMFHRYFLLCILDGTSFTYIVYCVSVAITGTKRRLGGLSSAC
jgi:hypothetical protein